MPNNTDKPMELREKILKEIDFLSDHWVKGDDRPPFSFGGWREEVADEIMFLVEEDKAQAIQATREETVEEMKEKLLHKEDYYAYGDLVHVRQTLDSLTNKSENKKNI